MAAFRTAASQYSAAVGGLHADAETVRLGAVPIIRLKRSFWHSESCFLSVLNVGAATSFAARLGKSAETHCG